ncbi:hypothetical protein EAO76_43765 [Streptomyces sp. sk2.1]|nr:hypothetical protein EAO76_43765 [Streptomyces sp. sk2.1]
MSVQPWSRDCRHAKPQTLRDQNRYSSREWYPSEVQSCSCDGSVRLRKTSILDGAARRMTTSSFRSRLPHCET